MMAQLLSLGLRRLRQPKVIAEVLGGILLGYHSIFVRPCLAMLSLLWIRPDCTRKNTRLH